jgi:hypothetical protein
MFSDPLTTDGAEIGLVKAGAALPSEQRHDGQGDETGDDLHPRSTRERHPWIMSDLEAPSQQRDDRCGLTGHGKMSA